MIAIAPLRSARIGFGLAGGQLRTLSTQFGKLCVVHTSRSGRRTQLRLVQEQADTATRLDAEMRWLAHLSHAHQLIVPRPLLWRNVQRISPPLADRHGNVWRAIACTWVSGRHLTLRWRPRDLRNAGAALAAMHRASQDAPTGIASARPSWWIPRLFELATSMRDLLAGSLAPSDEVRSELIAGLRRAQHTLELAYAHLPVSTDTVGLIHTDSHPRNIRLTHEGAGLVDFEDFANGRFMIDVAALWAELEHQPRAEQRLHALLDGYSGVKSLPSNFARDLHVMLAFRRFDLAGWVLSWPRTHMKAWGPALLNGAPAYIESHLSR